jgi:hydroxyacylglutathione hydrolase
MRNLFCPGLLETGPVSDTLMAVRDGMVNFYILKAPTGLICIDTGWRPAIVSHGFEILGLNIRDVAAVFVTHLHWDHARCLSLFAHAEIFVGDREHPPFFMTKHVDAQHLKRVKGDETRSAAGITVRVIETPGHSSGSVSYIIEDHLLFSGDTLRLKHGKVLPFLPWFNQDNKALNQSIHKLAGIKAIECLLTAHNGVGRDPQAAFAQWVRTDDALQQGGVGS